MDKKKQENSKEMIPEGWEVSKLLNVCNLINGRAFKPSEWSDDGLPIVRIENLNNDDACFNYCNFKVSDKYLLQANDLLISWSGTPGTSFGIFIWNRGKAILNQHIFKVILKEGVEKKYFYYAYKKLLVEMIRQSHGGVGLQHITKEDLKKFQILLPYLHEQSAIASILSTIDEAIEKTDQLIEKYKRIKQGLMQDLFRYGIDENGQIRSEKTHKFKDSPLGRIPDEWEVKEFIRVCILQRGFDLPNQYRIAGEIPIYGSNGIDGWHNRKAVNGPGVITGRSGTIGIVHYSSIDYWPLNTTLYVKNFYKNSSKFIWYFLSSINLSKYSVATGVPTLNRNFVHPQLVVIPGIQEQSRIASVLSSADEAIEKEQSYKEKLLSLKRGLMEDLLTGKVRIPQDLIKEISDKS